MGSFVIGLLVVATTMSAAVRTSCPSWQDYGSRLATLDYKRSAHATVAGCREACCDDATCVAATSVNSSGGGVQCYFHAEDRHTLADAGSFLMRRRNLTACGATWDACGASQECPKGDGITGTCVPGLSCGCPCATDRDCEQNQMDIGCGSCASRDPKTGIGSCQGPGSARGNRSGAACAVGPPGAPNIGASAKLDIVFVLDSRLRGDSWTAQTRLAARLAANFTTAPGGQGGQAADALARFAVVRVGLASSPPAAQASGRSALMLALTNDNATLAQILSLNPEASSDAEATTSSGLSLAWTQLEDRAAGRRRFVVVFSGRIDVNGCGEGDAASTARAMWADGVRIFSVAVSSTSISNTARMLASNPIQDHALALRDGVAGDVAVAAAAMVDTITTDEAGAPGGNISLCSRTCLTNAHCSGGAGGCDTCGGAGVCIPGSCGSDIPPGTPNLEASKHLQLLLVVDLSSNATAALVLRAAVDVALSFTTGPDAAAVGVIGYGAEASGPRFLVPLSASPGVNHSVAQLVCDDALRCAGAGGPDELTKALVLANTTLTGISNTSNDTELFQAAVVVTTQVRALAAPPTPWSTELGPAMVARSLWASGIHVASVVADDVCTYPAPEPGTVPGYQCGAADLLASSAILDGQGWLEVKGRTSRGADEAVGAGQVDADREGGHHGGGEGNGTSPPPLSLYDLRRQSTKEVGAAIAAELGRRRPPKCAWEEYAHRRLAFAFRTIERPSAGACVEACCRSRRCKAVSVRNSTGGTAALCNLHGAFELLVSAPTPDWDIFRKVDTLGCARRCVTDLHCQFTGCPKCNVIFQTCSAGYKCGCTCASNADCDQSKLDLGCSVCVKAPRSYGPSAGFGRCRSRFCGQPCKSHADCTDAPSCPVCKASSASSSVCSPPSPDPVPDGCVAPFPGHPHLKCSVQLDLVLILDGSGSIDSAAWLDILRFTGNIGLNFTTGHDFMKYAIIQFGSESHLYMPLVADNATFMQTIDMMPQLQSSTNTASAFTMADGIFNASGRPGAFKAVVILTDGMWNTGGTPLPTTDRMKKSGVRIFTVAVGDADNANVKALASLPLSKYYYNVTNEGFLPLILHKMILAMCDRDIVRAVTTGRHTATEVETAETAEPAGPIEPAELALEAAAETTARTSPSAGRLARQLHHRRIVEQEVAVTGMPATLVAHPARTMTSSSSSSSSSSWWGPQQPEAAGVYDCGDDGAGQWLQFRNGGLNPMRVETCGLDFNKAVCKGGAPTPDARYHVCGLDDPQHPTFVEPNTTLALRVSANVTYVVAIYCVNNPRAIHCMSNPDPLEFYGPTSEGGAWPSALEVPAPPGGAPYCIADNDCLSSKCNMASGMPPYQCT